MHFDADEDGKIDWNDINEGVGPSVWLCGNGGEQEMQEIREMVAGPSHLHNTSLHTQNHVY